MYDYDDIKLRLDENIGYIIFIKKSGERRHMLCTRNRDYVQSYCSNTVPMFESYEKKNNKKNNNIAVIDMQKKEVRSFNLSRVIEANFYEPCKDVLAYGRLDSEIKKKVKEYEDARKDENLEKGNVSNAFDDLD